MSRGGVGFPAFLVLAGLALVVRVGRWLGEHAIRPLVARQVATLDTVQETAKSQAKALETVAASMTTIAQSEGRTLEHKGREIPSTYEVSNLGNVRRLMPTGRYRALKGGKHRLGYTVQTLYSTDGRPLQALTHCLVWDAFGTGARSGFHIHHRNHDRRDNRLSNLARATPQAHRREHSKLSMDVARRIRRMHADGTRNKHIASTLSLRPADVSAIIHERIWRETA